MREFPAYLSDRKRDLLSVCFTDVERELALLRFYERVGVPITEGEVIRARQSSYYRNQRFSAWRTIDNIGLGKFIGTRA